MFVKFATKEEAEAKLPRLKAYHDARPIPGEMWVDMVATYDGSCYVLTLRKEDDQQEVLALIGGELVESIQPPVEQEGL